MSPQMPSSYSDTSDTLPPQWFSHSAGPAPAPQVQIEQVSGGPRNCSCRSAWGGMPVPLVWGPCFETPELEGQKAPQIQAVSIFLLTFPPAQTTQLAPVRNLQVCTVGALLCTPVSTGSVDVQRACPPLPVTCLSDRLVLSDSTLGAIPAGLCPLGSSGCRAP